MNNYDVETAEYLSHGIKLFVSQMFGPDEPSHMEAYVKLFQPHGTIIDMGSGIGETGAWIKHFNPSSRTISVTNSKVQASYMRDLGREHVLADFHETGIPDEIADCVMFNESFGYGNPEKLMQEASRILKVNGFLIVKDFTPIENIDKSFEFTGWDFDVHPSSRIISSAEKANLKLVWAFNKDASSDRYVNFFNSSKMKDWHKNISFPGISTCFKFTKISSQKPESAQ
jgi:ubiquinone/menaquinone biosynthesis C-methylase UbiE